MTCKSRERNNAGWARIGYLMVLLNRVYQGTPEKTRSLLEWLTESCHYQSTRMLSSPTLFDKFLALVVEFINHGHSLTHDSGRCVYFHCYRTTILIGDMPVLALRLDWWAQFLKKEKLLDTTANQLRDASPYDSAMRDDVPFYDVQTGIWPPLVDGRPYSEDEIEQAALTRAKPCIVIGMTYVNKFIADKLHTRKDIGTVLVKSQRADVGEYNFVEAVCSGVWFGFDTLDAHPFAPFTSALMDTVDPEIEREHEDQQLPVVEYCTSIEFMNKTFNTDPCTDELPPCLQDPYFLFNTEDEHPAKHACIRPRGGARPRAPKRTPGDNTLPIRPTTVTPTTAPTRTRTPARRLDLSLDEALSESELDHIAETYSLEELVTIFETEAVSDS